MLWRNMVMFRVWRSNLLILRINKLLPNEVKYLASTAQCLLPSLTRYSNISFVGSNNSLLPNDCCMKQTLRFKSKKKQQTNAEDSDEEDEEESDDDDNEDGVKDYRVIKKNLSSLRVDLVLKNGLGLSRSKVEEYFYESRIRKNGKKVFKKSDPVNIGDETDIIIGTNPQNQNFVDVSRVVVVKVKEERNNKDKVTTTMHRWKKLLINNYDDDRLQD